MTAIAVYAADAAERRRLEGETSKAAPQGAIAGAGSLEALARLRHETGADVVVAAWSPGDERGEWRTMARRAALIVIAEDGEAMIEAFHAGAAAVLPAAASAAHIAAALAATALGLRLIPRAGVSVVPSERPAAGAEGEAEGDEGGGPLSPRELEVLAALADGAANKTIARRLGISVHTAKFHVASILAKLDVDSRTEAVTQAARLGLVML